MGRVARSTPWRSVFRSKAKAKDESCRKSQIVPGGKSTLGKGKG